MKLDAMDYVRSALLNAHASGMSLTDVLSASIEAQNVIAFENAVNILGLATPEVKTEKVG